jgi:hypothetical protein
MTATELVEANDLRRAGGAMVVLAVVLPIVPGRPHLFCPLRTLTGVPCPMCGMTTSVEDTVHLRLREAFQANPAGIVAVAVAIFLLVRRPASLRVSVPLILVALALMWAFELHRFGFL